MSAGTDFDCDFCESSHWFGREGVCDFDNSVCICPEGFSGKDDWLTFTGCQVDDNLRRTLHIGLFCLCPTGAVACVISFFLLARKWNFRILPTFSGRSKLEGNASAGGVVSTQQAQATLFSPPSGNATTYKNASLQAVSVRNWKRKQYMLLTMLFFMIHYIGGILYNIPILSGDNREDNPAMVATGLTMAVVGARPATALVILVWYYSLPDVSRYGTLLGINSLLIRYPNFIPKALFWEIMIVTPILIGLMLVLPLCDLDVEIQSVIDLITVGVLLLTTVLDLMLFLLTIQTVEHVFQMAVEAFDERNGQTAAGNLRKYDISAMKNAMAPIKHSRTSVTVIHLIIAGFLLASIIQGGTANYFFITICFTLLCICLVPGPVAFFLLDDRLTPKVLKEKGLTASDA